MGVGEDLASVAETIARAGEHVTVFKKQMCVLRTQSWVYEKQQVEAGGKKSHWMPSRHTPTRAEASRLPSCPSRPARAQTARVSIRQTSMRSATQKDPPSEARTGKMQHGHGMRVARTRTRLKARAARFRGWLKMVHTSGIWLRPGNASQQQTISHSPPLCLPPFRAAGAHHPRRVAAGRGGHGWRETELEIRGRILQERDSLGKLRDIPDLPASHQFR